MQVLKTQKHYKIYNTKNILKGFKLTKWVDIILGMKEEKTHLTHTTEACWTGYKQVGMKKKGDKMV